MSKLNIIYSTEQNYIDKLSKELVYDNYKKSNNENLNPKIYHQELINSGFYILDDDEFLGGINFYSDFYGWLHIYMTWLSPKIRGKHFGTQLINQLKKFAKENNFIGITTETWEFQAKGFYEKNDFVLYGELNDHPKGIKEYYLFWKVK